MSTGVNQQNKKNEMSGVRAFMLMFVIGPIVGIVISLWYEYNNHPPTSDQTLLEWIGNWINTHSFVVIIGGILILSGVLFSIRYASGISLTMSVLGTWGSITGVFFFLASFFMLTRLNNHDFKWALLHPTDSFVLGTILFSIGFGGLLWFLIRLSGPQRPNVRRDPVFYLLFFLFFMGIIITGFLSGTFASASIEIAQEINPIVELPDDPSNPILAMITFLFSPLAGLYTIGFFIPLLFFPLILFVMADVSGTGTVKEVVDKAGKSRYYRSAGLKKHKRVVRTERLLKRRGGK